MPVSDKNQQIAVIISREWVKVLDQYMTEEILKSRSAAASRLLIKALQEWQKETGK